MGSRRIITRSDVVVVRPGQVATDALDGGGNDPTSQAPDGYLTKLIKIVPSEVIAAFLAIDGIVRGAAAFSVNSYWLVSAILLAICAAWVAREAGSTDKPFPFRQVLLSTGAFVVWVHAIGGPFEYAKLDWYDPAFAGILVILYTLAVPLLAKR
jgi:hypothetical protein